MHPRNVHCEDQMLEHLNKVLIQTHQDFSTKRSFALRCRQVVA